jgi:hypothetical protein
MSWVRYGLVGFALVLTACGGGGDGATGPGAGTLPLTAQNAEDAVTLVLGGGGEIGEINEGIDMLAAALGLDDEEFEPGTFPCPSGNGTFTVAVAGNSVTVTFNNCVFDFGEGDETLNGSLAAILVNDSKTALTIDLTLSAGTETLTIKGDMTVELLDAGGSSIRTIISGTSLAVTENGTTESLQNYRFDETVDLSTGDYSATVSGTATQTTLGGSVVFDTPTPLTGSGSEHPTAGVMMLRGSNGSVVRVTLMGEDVLFEIDANGDGTYDTSFTRTWSELDP